MDIGINVSHRIDNLYVPGDEHHKLFALLFSAELQCLAILFCMHFPLSMNSTSCKEETTNNTEYAY